MLNARAVPAHDVVIVGGGQAGLAASYHLRRRNIDHLVVERDRPFSAWHNRWDSFHMDTANWMNELPGARRKFSPEQRSNDLAPLSVALDYFQDYLEMVDPPLRLGEPVTAVEKDANGGWVARTSGDAFEARNVVICTGPSVSKLPKVASQLPGHVPSMHASEYRRPEQITTSKVVVVGSGASGSQICAELARSQRFTAVYLSVSNNPVIPRHVLGIPIGVYARLSGVFDMTPQSLLGRRVARSVSDEKGKPALTPSPAELHRSHGVLLTGKVTGANPDAISFEDEQIVAPDDVTMIWCTGYGHDHSFVKTPVREAVFTDKGPIHVRGEAIGARGLYFVGLRLQHTIGSHLLYGVGRDAEYIAGRIAQR